MGEAARIVGWIWNHLDSKAADERTRFLVYQLAMIELGNQGMSQFDNVSIS